MLYIIAVIAILCWILYNTIAIIGYLEKGINVGLQLRREDIEAIHEAFQDDEK